MACPPISPQGLGLAVIPSPPPESSSQRRAQGTHQQQQGQQRCQGDQHKDQAATQQASRQGKHQGPAQQHRWHGAEADALQASGLAEATGHKAPLLDNSAVGSTRGRPLRRAQLLRAVDHAQQRRAKRRSQLGQVPEPPLQLKSQFRQQLIGPLQHSPTQTRQLPRPWRPAARARWRQCGASPCIHHGIRAG